jgi:hypothetical protein
LGQGHRDVGVGRRQDALEGLEHLGPVQARVRVPLPGVHRVQLGRQPGVLDRLAQREEGRPVVGAELDDDLGSPVEQQVVHEPPVPEPGPGGPLGVKLLGLEPGIVQAPRLP